MQVTLCRHGLPRLPPLKYINSSNFNHWVNQYNQAGLDANSKPPDALIEFASRHSLVISSNLPRAIDSARCFSEANQIISDPLFNEAELPRLNGKHVKLSPKAWAVILRILWLTGLSTDCEGLQGARLRAVKGADRLVKLAQEKGSVLLLGHGVFNRLISDELRKRHWQGPKHPGHKHWACCTYSYNHD